MTALVVGASRGLGRGIAEALDAITPEDASGYMHKYRHHATAA